MVNESRRSFLCTLSLLLIAVGSPSGAQDAKSIRRVGILAGGAPPGATGVPASNWSPSVYFVEQLKSQGWKEGDNVLIERRYANGKLAQLPVLAQDLVQKNVDVIVVFGSPTIRPAVNATRTIPIVMMGGSADPVADGFVASLSRPGGNVTGVSWTSSAEIVGKSLALFRETVPALARMAVLADGAALPAVARAWQDASEKLGFVTQRFEINDPAKLEETMAAIGRGHFDAVYVGMGAATYSFRDRIAAWALSQRLPTMSLLREWPDAGGFLSYGASNAALVRRGTSYVDRILKGTRPADLPIEQPQEFELVINLRTAKALQITVPQTLLLQANDLIK